MLQSQISRVAMGSNALRLKLVQFYINFKHNGSKEIQYSVSIGHNSNYYLRNDDYVKGMI